MVAIGGSKPDGTVCFVAEKIENTWKVVETIGGLFKKGVNLEEFFSSKNKFLNEGKNIFFLNEGTEYYIYYEDLDYEKLRIDYERYAGPFKTREEAEKWFDEKIGSKTGYFIWTLDEFKNK
jgi:hypothetical protein